MQCDRRCTHALRKTSNTQELMRQECAMGPRFECGGFIRRMKGLTSWWWWWPGVRASLTLCCKHKTFQLGERKGSFGSRNRVLPIGHIVKFDAAITSQRNPISATQCDVPEMLTRPWEQVQRSCFPDNDSAFRDSRCQRCKHLVLDTQQWHPQMTLVVRPGTHAGMELATLSPRRLA